MVTTVELIEAFNQVSATQGAHMDELKIFQKKLEQYKAQLSENKCRFYSEVSCDNQECDTCGVEPDGE